MNSKLTVLVLATALMTPALWADTAAGSTPAPSAAPAAGSVKKAHHHHKHMKKISATPPAAGKPSTPAQ